jgi:hypothetical protein
MSLDLKSSEFKSTQELWKVFSESTDCELEATIKNLSKNNTLSFVEWQEIVKHLRLFGMKEEALAPKLNIMVPGGLRFTIVGDAAISEYCKTNTLKDKQFSAIIKEHIGDKTNPDSVNWYDYDVRIKLRRELQLSNDDERVTFARASWATLPKSFRYIKRFTFKSEKFPNIIFDASILKTSKLNEKKQYIQTKTFEESEITKSYNSYEFEIEAKEGADFMKFLTALNHVLRGLQGSYVLVRKSVAESVIELVGKQTGIRPGQFPGPMSVPLLIENISLEKDAKVPNIRFDDYNVTDKADGERCLMVVANDGRIYLVSRTMKVYGTDRRLGTEDAKELAGTILDGEWVTNDKDENPISHYYAFDIFNGKNGADVSALPFYVRVEDDESVSSRLAEMTYVIGKLRACPNTIAKIPSHQSLFISMKTFQPVVDPADSIGIFKEAASVLDRIKKDAIYHTDGLIFTPNKQGMPKARTWYNQFKWKPSEDNSVDFLVVTEKEELMKGDGVSSKNDNVRSMIDEEGKTIRYKTLRLFVNSYEDIAFNDPRKTVLNMLPIPESLENEKAPIQPVEFVPSEPYDAMASVCYVKVKEDIDSPNEMIYAMNDDLIYDKCIVEMVYEPSKPAGWRWMPLRVRYDKTETFQRKIIKGTANADKVAQDTWKSIHEPINEKMIRTGMIDDDSEIEISESYYGRRKLEIDGMIIRGMRDFHNKYIKNDLLIKSTVRAIGKDVKYFDMSIGRGGDIDKLIYNKVNFVLGCDIAEKGLVDKVDGSYKRYLKSMIRGGGRESVPPMIFIQADASKRYVDGNAGMNPSERAMLRSLFGRDESTVPPFVEKYKGIASTGFDIFASMFTLHYMFKDRITFDGWLMNLAECLKVGGYFVGCCFDGQTVAKRLAKLKLNETIKGIEGTSEVWSITKKYDDENIGILPNNDEGLGKQIDVNFASIGDTFPEYLMNFEYLKERLSAIGCYLLDEKECEEIGLKESTNMFEESHKMSEKFGRKFVMGPASREYSYFHRWFIFKRKLQGVAVPPKEEKTDEKIELDDISNESRIELDIDNSDDKDMEVKEIKLDSIDSKDKTEKIELEEIELKEASGPAIKFYSKMIEKDDLKIKDKSWGRYISTYTPFEFKDRNDPKVVYPNLEAALAAEKYKVATNKPDMAQTLFANFGTIHQEYEGYRAKAAENDKEIAKLYEEEGSAYRTEASEKGMKKHKVVFNKEKYDSVKESLIADYVRQRFERDERFRKIIQKAGELEVKLVYYTDSKGSNELGGIIQDNGTIEGENLYGRALMELVGLGY